MTRDVRRNRRGCPVRRLPDRDAARPQGLQGARRRPGDVPERHGVDAHDPRTGRRRAEPLGAPRPGDRDRTARPSTPTRSTSARSRSPAARGRRTATRRATRRAARCSTRSSSTRPPRAGAEVREGFTVEDVIVEDGTVVGIRGHDAGGTSVVERARVVIGADGRNSHVAKVVQPEQYNEKPNLQWSYYTYWSGLPVDAFETYIHPDRGWALLPTNDDLTLLVLGWPYAEANAYKADVEANYLKTLELTPAVAERVRGAKREERFYGGSVPNFFRKPYGPGMGPRRRRRLQQGPDHRAGHERRVPRRRGVHGRARRRVHRRPLVRRRHGGLPPRPRRARDADLRVHDAARDARSCRRPRCSKCCSP